MAERKAAAVSMDPSMFEDAKKRAKALGFSTFSAYVVQLLREDLQQRGALVLREDATSSTPTEVRKSVTYRNSKKKS